MSKAASAMSGVPTRNHPINASSSGAASSRTVPGPRSPRNVAPADDMGDLGQLTSGVWAAFGDSGWLTSGVGGFWRLWAALCSPGRFRLALELN